MFKFVAAWSLKFFKPQISLFLNIGFFWNCLLCCLPSQNSVGNLGKKAVYLDIADKERGGQKINL